MAISTPPVPADIVQRLRRWAAELGFQHLGITGVELPEDERRLLDWLAAGRHGTMDWMARHGTRRSRPSALVPGTLSVISARMNYLPRHAADPATVLADPTRAYVARYALGRDYHKPMRRRLELLARRLHEAVGGGRHRVFTDSAPVLEKPIARNAGLGWVGKHTNLLDRDAGSWFFIGEIYTDLALPADTAPRAHCGSCRACIEACPTGAIFAEHRLDARRCISYLTIEFRGSIPMELRPLIGNRIYGCDDCQIVCPWNRHAPATDEPGFEPRHGLDAAALVDLFSWSEGEFLERTAGSPIRRIGHERWLRNIAVALGNAPQSPPVRAALRARERDPSPLVREHVEWALRHGAARATARRPEQPT